MRPPPQQYAHTCENVVKAVAAGEKESAVEAFKMAVPVIDRTANLGLVHKNKAARFKKPPECAHQSDVIREQSSL